MKVIKLNESDIQRIVKRVLNEQPDTKVSVSSVEGLPMVSNTEEESKKVNKVCEIWDKMTHQQHTEFKDREDVSWHLLGRKGITVDAPIKLMFCKYLKDEPVSDEYPNDYRLWQLVNSKDFKNENWKYINDIIKNYG